MANAIINMDTQSTDNVILNGTEYARYIPGENPDGKVMLLAIVLTSQQESWTDKKTGELKTFDFYAKLGNFNKGIPVVEGGEYPLNLLVRANPPKSERLITANANFGL